MWIGSKVPPRMPVCTTPRIGGGWGDQPERPADVSGHTAKARARVDIPPTDADREMHTRRAVRASGGADDLTAGHVLPRAHAPLAEIGNRDLEARHRLDGDREHARHRSSKGDPTRCRSSHRDPHGSREVHAPMTAVLADWCEVGSDRAVDRSHETDREQRHLGKHLPSPGQRTWATRREPEG